MPVRERRQHQRLQFEQPLPAHFSSTEVDLADLSLRVARIIHQQPLQTGRSGPLRFHWLGHPITVEAEVVRCRMDRMADARGGNVYSSGLCYLQPHGKGDPLRELVEEHVVQAVREQIANARGTFIPLAERTHLFRSTERLSILLPPGEKRGRIPSSFLVCSLTERGWRKIASSDPAQPPQGFTVSALEDTDHVELLCRTYSKAGEQDRHLIRMLAEISIQEGLGRP
ncbi:MAG TPA: PilZ domain-containing protein [Thermoanaerobaculia bacterium]|nr:PilZ domain-containing protein [Thermoanaerobaculia bacterium]